jgi:transposase
MSKKKRDPQSLESTLRRRKVAALHLKGNSKAEIARQLGVSPYTVAKDLQKIEQEWKAMAVSDFADAVRKELRKQDLIELEAWNEWNKSREPQLTAEIQERSGVETKKRRLVHRTGDPRFLAIAIRCGVERRKLLKLDKYDPEAEKRDAELDPALSRLRVLETFGVLFDRERAAQAGAGPDAGQPRLLCPADERGTLDARRAPGASRPDDPGCNR